VKVNLKHQEDGCVRIELKIGVPHAVVFGDEKSTLKCFEQLSSHAHIFARSHTQEGGLRVSLLK
jgi:hypothetical protein